MLSEEVANANIIYFVLTRCDEVDLGQWFIHLLNITDYTGKN
jgi:endogenous inhibitor of DNA gyrase (YacG/DUF329 family)